MRSENLLSTNKVVKRIEKTMTTVVFETQKETPELIL